MAGCNLTTHGRPSFIPRDRFRAWLKRGELARLMRVDGGTTSAFIARAERCGRPIRTLWRGGFHLWRPIDIVVRAYGDAVSVDPPEHVDLEQQVERLRYEKARLEQAIEIERHHLAMAQASAKLTGRTLLRASEIAEGRQPPPVACGVYFLLRSDKIVYVGQSTNVFGRVVAHLRDKKFDGYAYVACPPESLDLLESLYIHTLRPELNGIVTSGNGACAPLSLDRLLEQVTLL